MARGPGADRQSQLQHPGILASRIPASRIPSSRHPCILVYCMHAVHVANRSSSQSFRLEYLFDALGKMQKKALGKVRRLTAGQSHIFCDLFLQLLPVTFYPLKKKNTEPLLIEARAKPDIKYAKGISALSWAANK